MMLQSMIFAIVQIIGFSNSICNPIVYAFMNENFKKNFLSAVCYCIVKETHPQHEGMEIQDYNDAEESNAFPEREPS